jgi:hypothetical protein
MHQSNVLVCNWQVLSDGFNFVASQHIPGGGAIGCEHNRLRRADPVVNIVEDKLLEAQQYFRALGLP